MLMSNYALVRILVLRFVISYASTKVNSCAMKLHPTCGALFGVIYAQCSLMRLFVSWLVASQSFASLHFSLSMISTCASKSFKPVLPHESTISTYMRYFRAVLSKFVCAISNFKINFSFVWSYHSRGGEGWPIFSMLRYVILMMSVYPLVIARE